MLLRQTLRQLLVLQEAQDFGDLGFSGIGMFNQGTLTLGVVEYEIENSATFRLSNEVSGSRSLWEGPPSIQTPSFDLRG